MKVDNSFLKKQDTVRKEYNITRKTVQTDSWSKGVRKLSLQLHCPPPRTVKQSKTEKLLVGF